MEKNKTDVIIDADEFAIAEQEIADGVGSYTHTFNPPLEYQGKKYKELTFDRHKFKGNDDIAILREMRQLGLPTFMAEYEPEYLYRLAARTCTEQISFDAFRQMDGADSVKIRRKLMGFLSKKASSSVMVENGSDDNA